jgi:hypothetical protein
VTAAACPSCNKALPPSVVNGPAQAVVRCEGCQTLLLWSNGRVMRSAKSSTPTVMGMPAVQVPAATVKPAPPRREPEAPLPELKPEGDVGAPPKPTGPSPSPRTATWPPAKTGAPKQTMMGIGDNAPTKVSAPPAELLRKGSAAGPAATTPPVTKPAPLTPKPLTPKPLPSMTPKPTAKPEPAAPAPVAPDDSKRHVLAAVAKVPKMSAGEMVNPSDWFAGGDTSDVMAPEALPPIPGAPTPTPTIESAQRPRRDTTGAAPLPPPPELLPLQPAPFDIEAPSKDDTPPAGTLLSELRPNEPSEAIAVRAKEPSAPIAVRAKEPSGPLRTPPPKKPAMPPRAAEPLVSRPSTPLPPALTPSPAATPPPAPTPPAATPTPPPAATPPAAEVQPIASAPALVERESSAPRPTPAVDAMPSPVPSSSLLQPETMQVPRTIPRRTLVIGGAVAGGIILVVLLAVGLGGSKKRPTPAPPPVAATAPQPPVAAPPLPPPVAAPAAAAPTEPPAETKPQRPRRTLGGKKVVLEYDPKPTSPTPPPPQAPTPTGEDPAVVARARDAYHKGNVKLFAGDAAGAIALYRESLKIYPGYVAGYRGLGLGYEAAGNNAEALKAFRTYVQTVPNANDVALVRHRINRLQGGRPAAR